MSAKKQSWIERVWYGKSLWYWLLLPLSGLFAVLISIRRALYRRGILRSVVVDVPVIVVGNVSVGGTGKSPVSIWLAERLGRQGKQPGIILRGYRGNVGPVPVVATEDSDAAIVGDEAIMMARQCECPVVVHPDRVAAAKKAIELGADVIVSDDGLQHYRLGRDIELVVVDGSRGFGNGRLLPAGPLRESVSRLDDADMILIHRTIGAEQEFNVMRRSSDPQPLDFWLKVAAVVRLDNSEALHLDDFADKTVHAIAGIGHPERFFRLLESHRVKVYRHPLADHASIEPADINYGDELDVLMTEKDAVKCRWLDTSKCWYVPVDVYFEAAAERSLIEFVMAKLENRQAKINE